MSKKGKSKDWDKLWNEYSTLLKKWRQTFGSLQKVSKEIQVKYYEVMQKAINESSQNTMKEFTENWQKAMNQDGLNAFKQFGENWQKTMNQSGMGQLDTYGEMMSKFAETWQKMWRK